MTGPPRYSAEALPPYAYVPGRNAHPIRSPAGHLFGKPPAVEVFDPAAASASPGFRMAADLFNHGFPWEAHERWEGLWHSIGRQGVAADLLKALIQFAAAKVKVLQSDRMAGARLATRALGLVQASVSKDGFLLGVDWGAFTKAAAAYRDRLQDPTAAVPDGKSLLLVLADDRRSPNGYDARDP